ncbi:hypothetical protein [Mesomycoplasma hyopneumoniae]|uniref:hypothetical protein n=1 Tax=Mesomycoplasma hyopneumoniae TaxID=2099 RepID=UPI001004EA69|nr:hypothetical protein [Mesomycoplasma hyopneumoniae]VEU65274.1 Uncharacterised protein [Mesomycoplasma hyopneumoniae]
MNFQNKDYDSLLPLVDKKILTKNHLYTFAGNSIIVSILEALLLLIYEINNKIRF